MAKGELAAVQAVTAKHTIGANANLPSFPFQKNLRHFLSSFLR
jgi:hypothetical protein